MFCNTVQYILNGQTLTKNFHAIKDGVVATDFCKFAHVCAQLIAEQPRPKILAVFMAVHYHHRTPQSVRDV